MQALSNAGWVAGVLLRAARTAVALLALACAVAAPARAENLTARQQLALDIYRELIEIDTVTATGDTGRAADAMAARLRLRNAGIPTYGHSGLAGEIGDRRAHGKDERVAVKSFFDGVEYQYRLVRMLAGGR